MPRMTHAAREEARERLQEFAAQIDDLRQLDLKDSEIADAIPIDHGYFTRVMHGQQVVSGAMLQRAKECFSEKLNALEQIVQTLRERYPKSEE